MLLAETKESESMDTSSKQQRTYKDSKIEVGREEIAKSWNLEPEKSEERRRGATKERRKRTRKKSKGGGEEKSHKR